MFCQLKRYPLTYFNSIKVRLELILIYQMFGNISFQFHKGTIRTQIKKVLIILLIPIFQFHKGTIRTKGV